MQRASDQDTMSQFRPMCAPVDLDLFTGTIEAAWVVPKMSAISNGMTVMLSPGSSFLAARAAASAKRTSREMVQMCTNPYLSFAGRSGRDFSIFRIKVTLLSWHLSMECV